MARIDLPCAGFSARYSLYSLSLFFPRVFPLPVSLALLSSIDKLKARTTDFILFLFFFPFSFLLVARCPRNRRFRGESKVKISDCFIEVREEISNESFSHLWINIALHNGSYAMQQRKFYFIFIFFSLPLLACRSFFKESPFLGRK